MIALLEYFEFLLLIMESEIEEGGRGGTCPPLKSAPVATDHEVTSYYC